MCVFVSFIVESVGHCPGLCRKQSVVLRGILRIEKVFSDKNIQILLPMMSVVLEKIQTVLSSAGNVFDKIQTVLSPTGVVIDESGLEFPRMKVLTVDLQ